ncbi:conserved hypothetical protein (hdrA-flxDCBA-associated) [Candidatus Desulfosporosinus infrequens]|uniref:Uncharacterized protein n=1 Tax=Candidatus Desulfosporosinus infrequens TaxID=2043169 RepID=A0A2U3LWH6_9FIRM|nr:conserved hypothetical protein (hdrA-flxDCBA-associated) [Candidatus Desulfosporosinus infrequens]
MYFYNILLLRKEFRFKWRINTQDVFVIVVTSLKQGVMMKEVL